MNPKKLQRLRRQAFVRQDCLCFYCELPIWQENPECFALMYGVPHPLAENFRATAEHLLARQDNGGDTADNIVASCLWCNRLRHLGRRLTAPEPAVYKAEVLKLVAQGKWHPVVASDSARMVTLASPVGRTTD